MRGSQSAQGDAKTKEKCTEFRAESHDSGALSIHLDHEWQPRNELCTFEGCRANAKDHSVYVWVLSCEKHYSVKIFILLSQPAVPIFSAKVPKASWLLLGFFFFTSDTLSVFLESKGGRHCHHLN